MVPFRGGCYYPYFVNIYHTEDQKLLWLTLHIQEVEDLGFKTKSYDSKLLFHDFIEKGWKIYRCVSCSVQTGGVGGVMRRYKEGGENKHSRSHLSLNHMGPKEPPSLFWLCIFLNFI